MKMPDFDNASHIQGCTAIGTLIFYLVCPYCEEIELELRFKEIDDKNHNNYDLKMYCCTCDKDVIVKHQRETSAGHLAQWMTLK